MELIKILNTRVDISGHYRRWCLFLCPYCLKLVELISYVGIKQKSCGCITNKGVNNPMYGKHHTDKARKNIGKNRNGIKRTEEVRQKIKENHADFSLEKHPNWQDGKSFEIYPQEFKQIKQTILERDNYICQYPNCNEVHDRLHVHHIDFNKKNNSSENLITLGHSCHMKTNGKNNRIYWTEFYQNIMINRIIECLL